MNRRKGARRRGGLVPERHREIAIYSGRERIGGIKIDGGEYVAFDTAGKLLGRFADQKSAAFAIDAAEVEARSTKIGPAS